MDAAQAIETVREGLRYECDPISEAIGEGCGTCAGCKGYAALSVVEAQLATHDAAMAAANREVLRCMDERDGWKRAHDLAAADWRAAEAERDDYRVRLQVEAMKRNRLLVERDELRGDRDAWKHTWERDRYEWQAERDKLREILEDPARHDFGLEGMHNPALCRVCAALARSETPSRARGRT